MAYQPNAAVRQAHAMPHLNTNLQPAESSDFALSIEYITSIVGFPALILVITVLLMFCYCFALFCAGCLRCCKCPGFKSKQLNQGDPDFTLKAKKQLSKHKKLVYCLIGLLLSLWTTNFFLWLGSHEITVAFTQINNGLDSLKTVFSDISSGANKVSESNIKLNLAIATACTGISSSEISTAISAISNSASSISSMTSVISVLLGEAKIGSEIDTQKDIVVGIYFAVIFLLGFIFSFALYFHNKLLFRFSILLTWLITFTLFIIASLEILILMLVGDFCMDPTGTILKLVKSGVIEFYLTCKGINPLQVNLDSINSFAKIVQEALKAALAAMEASQPGSAPASCEPTTNPIFVEMTASTTAMTNPIGNCVGVYGAYKSFVLDATCTSGFNGIYNVWAVQFALAAILYVTMVFANAVYQSYVYADGNKIHPMTEKDIEDMNSPQVAEVELVKPSNDYDNSLENGEAVVSVERQEDLI